jgi:hypothetical protein
MKKQTMSRKVWVGETGDSNRLFAGADMLNEAAYRLLSDRPTTSEKVKNFEWLKMQQILSMRRLVRREHKQKYI